MNKFILFCSLFFACGTAVAEPFAQVNYQGKIWYVDVAASGSVITVWLREKRTACGDGDRQVMTLRADRTTLKKSGEMICRAKRVYDNGKTIVGCTSVALSGACAVATVATEGAAAVICTATWTYAAEQGIRNCIDGVSDRIAERVGYGREWASLNASMNIGAGKIKDAVNSAIDAACAGR